MKQHGQWKDDEKVIYLLQYTLTWTVAWKHTDSGGSPIDISAEGLLTVGAMALDLGRHKRRPGSSEQTSEIIMEERNHERSLG